MLSSPPPPPHSLELFASLPLSWLLNFFCVYIMLPSVRWYQILCCVNWHGYAALGGFLPVYTENLSLNNYTQQYQKNTYINRKCRRTFGPKFLFIQILKLEKLPGNKDIERKLGENSGHSQPVLSVISLRNNNINPSLSVPSARNKQEWVSQMVLKIKVLSLSFSLFLSLVVNPITLQILCLTER